METVFLQVTQKTIKIRRTDKASYALYLFRCVRHVFPEVVDLLADDL